MLYVILCMLVVAYLVSVIASYQILGDSRNDTTILYIVSLLGRDRTREFSHTDMLYFFATPWIPFLNTYLIYKTIRDNPELSIQVAYFAHFARRLLARFT